MSDAALCECGCGVGGGCAFASMDRAKLMYFQLKQIAESYERQCRKLQAMISEDRGEDWGDPDAWRGSV